MKEPTWEECLLISELPKVDEAIRNFLEDQTEDNAVCMVREILQKGNLCSVRNAAKN